MAPHHQHLSGSPGEVRTRDGRTLRYFTTGVGAPLVVLEAGMGAPSMSWRPTYEALAGKCRVVAYDRSGLGGSDRDASPRTLDRLVDDLEDLLVGLDEGRAVLVGHSYGALLIRRLTARRPDLVHAVVLADPTDEAVSFVRSPLVQLANRVAYRVMAVLAWLGLLGRLQMHGPGRRLIDAACVGLGEVERTAFATEFFSARHLRAASAEMKHLGPALRAVSGSPRALPVPVTVISADGRLKSESALRSEILTMHAEFATLSPHGRHVVAQRSGHYVPIDAPEVLVQEITLLLPVLPVATVSGERGER